MWERKAYESERPRIGNPFRLMSNDHPLLEQDEWLSPDEEAGDRVDAVLDELTSDDFEDWYREWHFTRNIENGNAYFNKTGYVPDEKRNSPSKLLQCHRKQVYSSYNAPAEAETPTGIFWIGTKFEEEIVQPYLESYANRINENNYVQNSMWVDFSIDVGGDLGTVEIRGETDPVIVDKQANPLVVTEVKNKKSLSKFEGVDDPEPDPHHKAQLHAYMYGLSESFERDIDRGIMLYGSRETHDLIPIPVEFDQEFWEAQVVEWAKTQSEYRLNDELPPKDPHFSWECKFCDYATRCGMGDDPPWQRADAPVDEPDSVEWKDVGVDGFVPLTEYPFEAVVEYMRAHGPKGAKLTPTLAHMYPQLADKFDVMVWKCPNCQSEYPSAFFDWSGNPDHRPKCANCESSLRAPDPSDQH